MHIYIASIYDSFLLSLVPKEAAGASTHVSLGTTDVTGYPLNLDHDIDQIWPYLVIDVTTIPSFV